MVARDITEYVEVDHHEAEEIEKRSWFSFDEVEEMCKEGEIQEGRTVAVLLKFLYTTE